MHYFYKAPPRKKSAPVIRALSLLPGLFVSKPKNEAVIAESASRTNAEVISLSHESRSILLQATEAQKEAIEAEVGVRLHPNHPYHVASLHEAFLASASATSGQAAGPHPYEFFIEGTNGKPVVDARVVVVYDENLASATQTDSSGIARLSLSFKKAAEVHIFPRENYWCAAAFDIATSPNQRKLLVEPIELPYLDSLSYFYPIRSFTAGQGVKVAVIDTGIDEHTDLPKLIVQKTVLNGVTADGCKDSWAGHGTHVAGIIAGKKYGIAPSVELMGYRVFPDIEDEPAQSLDISTAIDLAVVDGAHVINLSLGWEFRGQEDEPVVDSIQNAINNGVLVVAATGNNAAAAVMFPSNMDSVCAVGAVGVAERFAPSSTHRFQKARVNNSDNEFVAHFSNYEVGKVQLAGPGLAVVSTVSTNGYSAKTGTSMAAPVISGIAASILSANPELLKMQGSQRVAELQKLLYNDCDNLGFDSKYVGAGVPAYRSDK